MFGASVCGNVSLEVSSHGDLTDLGSGSAWLSFLAQHVLVLCSDQDQPPQTLGRGAAGS